MLDLFTFFFVQCICIVRTALVFTEASADELDKIVTDIVDDEGTLAVFVKNLCRRWFQLSVYFSVFVLFY